MPMRLSELTGMAATAFLASLLLGTNGFGFALLAVPGLLLFAPPAEAVQIVIIVSVAVLLAILPALRDAVDGRLLLRFLLGSLGGVPLGLLAFRWADPAAVRIVVGTAVLCFAAVLALRRWGRLDLALRMRAGRDLAAGAAAGAATALAGISGPPVVIYLLLAEVPMRTFRATLAAFFMWCYAATLLADVATIGVSGKVWLRSAILIPFAWAGGVCGRRLGDRLGADTAGTLALAVLTAAGLYTLFAALD
jgi:uncharacterized protein